MATLPQDEIDAALAGDLSAWHQDGDAITREVAARTFLQGITLVQQVAEAAEAMNHHPDIDVRYTTLTFTLSTHSEGGLTAKDLDLAGEIDRLVADAESRRDRRQPRTRDLAGSATWSDSSTPWAPRPAEVSGRAGLRGVGHLDEPAGLDVVDVAVDRDAGRHQRVVADPLDVLGDAGGVVRDRQEVDVVARVGAGPLADVGEAVGAELGGLQAARQQAPDHVVGEELHAAVGVVDHEPLRRAEQLVGDHQGADRVVAGAAAGVADHVGVALGQAGVLGRVEAGVHAGQDGEAAGRGKGQVGLVAERGGVRLVGRQDLVVDAHGCSLR